MPSLLKKLPRIAPVRVVLLGFPLLLALGLVMAFHFEYQKGKLPLPYLPAIDYAGTTLLSLCLLLLYAGLVRVLERRRADELALRPGVRWLGIGVLTGFALFNLVCGTLVLAGVFRWGGFNGFAGAGPAMLMALVAGIGEELIFRGVLFRIVEESAGTAIAMLVSAAFFGLIHAGNPGATTLSSVAIALEAGLLLAAAYAWSRSLWLVIGLHFAWNFTEGGIYGATVSGGGSGKGVVGLLVEPGASEMLSGGAFGPEASVIAVMICVAAAVAFAVFALKAQRWRPLSLRLVLA